ncbi:uncharacterized protein LOC125025701 [Penaeus chinensis]|uniref:uncharacterized protein LOC125025701 n=1 Tax=Penaeus chinensis TaxID=139456 RepID=UPI001FB61D84|nr:uncharacterized protein LOC125025701 [Penaeus chinensis]XP_047469779.1 uncharacterized protein LOC125025701 [Penaeus chinensis]
MVRRGSWASETTQTATGECCVKVPSQSPQSNAWFRRRSGSDAARDKMKLMLILQACLVVATMAETWQQKYDTWASNLKPGWTIQTTIQDGRKCYCKMPNETLPSTSSFGGFISSGNLASVESVKSSFEHIFLTPP